MQLTLPNFKNDKAYCHRKNTSQKFNNPINIKLKSENKKWIILIIVTFMHCSIV